MTEQVWALEVSGDAPGTYLSDEDLQAAMAAGGLSPLTVRECVSKMRNPPLTLDLIELDGVSLYNKPVPVGDVLLYSWFPLFSERASQLLIALGCVEEEFIDCRLRVLPDTAFKAHLPLKHFDVVDLSRSIARHQIPMDPPIPFYFDSVRLKRSASGLPPCFRVPAPGHPQVLSELFALESLREAWQAAGLQGANFRLLSGDAP